MCPVDRRAPYGSKRIICHSEMTLKGGMECAPTINIKFYACCTFQKPQEDIDSSKCHLFFNDLSLFTFNSFRPEVGTPTWAWGPGKTEGVVSSCGCRDARMRSQGGREGMLGGRKCSFQSNAARMRVEAGVYVFHYIAGILRKLRGVVLSGWSGGAVWGTL